MQAKLIDGKALAAQVKAEAAAEAAALKAKGVTPCLAVVLVGEDPASQVYVRGKAKDCGECGIDSRVIRLPEATTQAELLALVAELAADRAVNGILVQLPLPAHIDEKAVIDAIPPEKDVDGFSPCERGPDADRRALLSALHPRRLRADDRIHRHQHRRQACGGHRPVQHRGQAGGHAACWPKTPPSPSAHSHTANLQELCRSADILVAAVGRAGFVTGDMVKPGAVVIDVGINRGADGKLHGDVDFAAAAEKAAYITPVPGGVGPMTRAMLMKNTTQAAARQNGLA